MLFSKLLVLLIVICSMNSVRKRRKNNALVHRTTPEFIKFSNNVICFTIWSKAGFTRFINSLHTPAFIKFCNIRAVVELVDCHTAYGRYFLTQKICATICLHDSSKIKNHSTNSHIVCLHFSCGYALLIFQRILNFPCFFNWADVWCWLQIVIIRNKVD